MLRAMFCWETLGPAIPVDGNLTCVTYLNIVADQVHPFMAMVFPDGRGLFQQDNAPCPTAHIVREWFEEHDEVFTVLPWPPDTTGHLQGSCRVHASAGRRCFGGTRRTNSILGRWS